MYLEASYELITTTRFDPFLSTLPWNDSPEGPSDFLLLRYHFDRLVHAVALHGWDSDKARSSLTYDRLKSVCHATLTGNDSQKDMSRALKVCPRAVLSPHLATRNHLRFASRYRKPGF